MTECYRNARIFGQAIEDRTYVLNPSKICFAMNWQPRLAREEDVPALAELIRVSSRALQAPYYSAAQIEAALGPIFAVDRQLIRDGTYFVVEQSNTIVGCGGWSK